MDISRREALEAFVKYVSRLDGDEKGEAQVFLDRLFQGFGHTGYKEAGAVLESRVRAKGRGTRFADLLWAPRVLIEMKKRGENLFLHYGQARDYWHDTYPKPRYVVLCNFDEFWVYDFFNQSDPVDKVALADLPTRYLSLAFLLSEETRPQFGNDRVAVSRKAADAVARMFNELVGRGEDRDRAQRFVLQCVFCLFAEDFELLPRGLFTNLINDAAKGGSSFDLFGQLFKQMDSRQKARAGRFKDVDYFNGGLFANIDPIELRPAELALLQEASMEDWSKVQPPIFGALFEGSMGKKERHAFGAHFTSEADIMKVVRPTIERPWLERIEAAKTLKELNALRDELLAFRVLDPACGCGNFLYVAYREMRRLEMRILMRIHQEFGSKAREQAGTRPQLKLTQFHGIDINGFAVELAKVTLMLGREQGIEETRSALASGQLDLPLEQEPALPLDNLDDNIVQADALFTEWPEVEAIVGNPPYLGSRFLAQEHGYPYARKVQAAFPDVPKMVDLCVYWFRKAHDRLPENGRAGLVGTNTIRQNETREASLDYVLANAGTITEAVSTQVWSGEAQVHVSIVNWIKGDDGHVGPRFLFTQRGDDSEAAFETAEVATINSALAARVDVSGARELAANQEPKRCFVGQYPFNEGFLLSPEDAHGLVGLNASNKDVLFPYMIGRDLIESSYPSRWIIDFGQRSLFDAMKYPLPFAHVKERVMPDVLAHAEAEKKATGKATTRWTRMAERWWQFRDYQPGTMAAITSVPRYIAVSRITKRPIFEFVSRAIHPDNTIVVFPLKDDYSYGLLQSGIHWAWFVARCSTLTERFRYTSTTVFDTFPWPQSPTLKQAQAVAKAAVELRALRRRVMDENGWSLRDLYRTLETAGANPLRDAQDALDAAVRAAYGMKKSEDVLAFLLRLNHEVADREAQLLPVTGPGLPPCVADPKPFVTKDCIQP